MTLQNDLVYHYKIYLLETLSKFTLIEVEDIGAVLAKVIVELQNYINKSYKLTYFENISFSEMVE